MNYKTLISIVLFIGMLFSCSNKFDTSDYVKWVKNPENGLRKQRSTSSAEYILQYEPAFYKAISMSEKSDKENLKSLSTEFEELHHFLLRVKINDASFHDEKAVSQYLAYEMRKKIRFAEGADTVNRTVMYHLESSGGITPYQRILVAFPKASNTGNMQFIIEPGMFESDKLVFNFDKSDIDRLETINNRIE